MNIVSPGKRILWGMWCLERPLGPLDMMSDRVYIFQQFGDSAFQPGVEDVKQSNSGGLGLGGVNFTA